MADLVGCDGSSCADCSLLYGLRAVADSLRAVADGLRAVADGLRAVDSLRAVDGLHAVVNGLRACRWWHD